MVKKTVTEKDFPTPLGVGAICWWRGLKVEIVKVREDGSIECVGVGNNLHSLHVSDVSELQRGE